MKRVKFRISTWDEGRKFMKEVAIELNTKIEVRDAKEVITTNDFEIHFHPDDRGFSFISCKILNESREPVLKKIISRYKE
jgi:hypothetical protein